MFLLTLSRMKKGRSIASLAAAVKRALLFKAWVSEVESSVQGLYVLFAEGIPLFG